MHEAQEESSLSPAAPICSDSYTIQPPGISNLPTELLIGITTYLTPPSLLSLCCTNKRLHEHVKDDKVWFWAFLYYFSGTSPEHDLRNAKISLLKRTTSTWRKEFILRYKLLYRWEQCRSPVIEHSPLHNRIRDMLLVSDRTLLAYSLSGTASRSFPLRPKIPPYEIYAPSDGEHPWSHFFLNVSTCALMCKNDFMTIIWGKRNGEVSIIQGDSVTDPIEFSKYATQIAYYEHTAAVQQIVPDSTSNTFVSGGADGRVKIWEVTRRSTPLPLWTSKRQRKGDAIDAVVSVAGSLRKRCIAGALKSGDIVCWFITEPVVLKYREDDAPTINPTEIRLPDPIHEERQQSPNIPPKALRIKKIWLCRISTSQATLFIQYTHHSSIYRISVDAQSNKVETTRFGQSSDVHVSVVEPYVTSRQSDSRASLIFVGDKLGFVSIYDSDAPLVHNPISPLRRFEAHIRGKVTAIAWDTIVLATGSSHGAAIVWDALTLAPLRSFQKPPFDWPSFTAGEGPEKVWTKVRKIVLGNDIVVVAMGSDVMAWKLERVGKSKQKNTETETKKNRDPIVTFPGLHEPSADTTRIRKLEDEERSSNHEPEQQSTSDSLGTSEQDAMNHVSKDVTEEPQPSLRLDEGNTNAPATPSESQSSSSPKPLSPLPESTSCHTHNSAESQNSDAPTSSEGVWALSQLSAGVSSGSIECPSI